MSNSKFSEKFMNSSSLLPPIFLGTTFLFLWELCVIYFQVPNYLLPKPTSIFQALWNNKIRFFHASCVTMGITLCAIFLSAFLGSVLSILLFWNKKLEKSLSPFLILLQITPIISIIPLLIIWFKSNTIVTLIICSCICSLFPIISSMNTGLKQTDKSLAMIFQLYGASRWKKLLKLDLPSALPYFLNGLQISSALALIGCISAEFIAGSGGRNSGIAYELLMAGYNLQTDILFAALFVITGLGLILHFLFGWVQKLDSSRFPSG